MEPSSRSGRALVTSRRSGGCTSSDASDALAGTRARADLGDYLSSEGVGALLDAPVCSRGKPVGILCHEHVGRRARPGATRTRSSGAPPANRPGARREGRGQRAAASRGDCGRAARSGSRGRRRASAKVFAARVALADAAGSTRRSPPSPSMATLTLFEGSTSLQLRAGAGARHRGEGHARPRRAPQPLACAPRRVRLHLASLRRAPVARHPLGRTVGDLVVRRRARRLGEARRIARNSQRDGGCVPAPRRAHRRHDLLEHRARLRPGRPPLRRGVRARLIEAILENALLHERAARRHPGPRRVLVAGLSRSLDASRSDARVDRGDRARGREGLLRRRVHARAIERCRREAGRSPRPTQRSDARRLRARRRAGDAVRHRRPRRDRAACRPYPGSTRRLASDAGSAVTLDGDAAVVGRWDGPRLQQALSGPDRQRHQVRRRPPDRGRGSTAETAMPSSPSAITGLGIPGDQVDRIFERYHRAVSARSYGGARPRALGRHRDRRGPPRQRVRVEQTAAPAKAPPSR